ERGVLHIGSALRGSDSLLDIPRFGNTARRYGMIRLLPFLIAVSALAQQPGEALFFGKAACASCHQVNGRGGVVGPDLSNAGRLSAEALHQKIVDPSANPNPGGLGGPSTMVAHTKDGKEIRGIRRAEDTFSLLITDNSGNLVRL